jgi:5-bromo-4-chloroindolyl phosphate hydrolysis protein
MTYFEYFDDYDLLIKFNVLMISMLFFFVLYIYMIVCVCIGNYNFALVWVLTNRVTFPDFTFLHRPIEPT